MSGKDYQLTDYITLHHPSIKEIMDINNSLIPEETYWTYVNILLSDPYTNMVMLDDIGKNYLEVSPYEIFIIQWNRCLEEYNKNKATYDLLNFSPISNFVNAINFFINETRDYDLGKFEDGKVCIFDPSDISFQIDQNIFECISEWVKCINKIEFSDRICPADENARRILIEDMRDELKKTKRKSKSKRSDNSYLGNIMSATCFCGNGSITPFNMRKCKIYWLNEAMTINSKKSNVDHILDGMYHGTISSKDINKEELNWLT